MFKFVQEGKEYFVKYPNNEKRLLNNSEIESFYQRINSVLDILDLKSEYEKTKEQRNINLIEYATEKDIDLDACLYAVLSQFRLEKPLV
ncbi:MAG: hypothetical protein H7263_01965 [Candidatus Sericytochromatia bacterium]|nr:hypothetical protein [Candidatus Sericytochromatia bacterium]